MSSVGGVERGDACAWTNGARCGGSPRSCRACLDGGNNECALGSLGECVSQQALASSASVHSSILFIARNTSYCATDDGACSHCAQQWRADAARGVAVSLTASCVGANGCVCLAACELPTWETRVLEAAQCSTSSRNNSSIGGSSVPYPSAHTTENSTPSTGQLLIAGAVCFVAVTAFALISLGLGKLVRKMDRSAQATHRERFLNAFRLPQRAPTGPQLQLEGWTSMREKLVQDGATASAPSLAPPISLTAECVQRSDNAVQDQRELWIRW